MALIINKNYKPVPPHEVLEQNMKEMAQLLDNMHEAIKSNGTNHATHS